MRIMVIGIVAVMILLSSVSFAQEQDKRVMVLLRDASECEDLKERIGLLDKAIEVDQKCEEAYYMRGDAYMRLGEMAKALADFDKILELNKKSLFGYVGRASVNLSKGEYDKAIKDYDKAIEIDDTRAPLFYDRGMAHFFAKNHDKAIEDFSSAIKINMSYMEAYYSRAWAYVHAGNLAKAKKDFESLYKNGGEDNEPYYLISLAVCMMRGGEKADAEKKLNDYLDDNPGDEWSGQIMQFLTGKIKQDELLKAAEHKDAKMNAERLCEGYYYIAMYKLVSGDKKGAAEFLKKCVDTDVKYYIEWREAKFELEALKK